MARNVARLHRGTGPPADLLGSGIPALESSNRAANTIGGYTRSAQALIRWAGDRADTGITTEDLRGFFAAELARIAPASVASHYRNLHVFFTWLATEEPSLVPVNPMAAVVPPTVPKRRKPPFSDDELRKLLAAAAGGGVAARGGA